MMTNITKSDLFVKLSGKVVCLLIKNNVFQLMKWWYLIKEEKLAVENSIAQKKGFQNVSPCWCKWYSL